MGLRNDISNRMGRNLRKTLLSVEERGGREIRDKQH